MAEIGTGVATHVANTMVDKAMMEARYLCCYKSYVENFEKGKGSLSATVESVRQRIRKARNRNENQIDPKVQKWLEEADSLIQQDTKAKKKWFFGLCVNCFWQHGRAKELEGETQKIKELVNEESNFRRVAHSDGLPGIEYHHSSQSFMHFESRKFKFEELKEALKDENLHVIGMQGMGGTGKTTMAIEVGNEVQQSKLFDKVILSVVSKDAQLQKIRGDIAKHLDLPLDGGMDESEQAERLWKRIVEGGEKLLIILDDVWEELNLKDIGIKPGCHGKGRCSVLLTTRDLRVCTAMDCQKTIQLDVLSVEDALNLFLSHAGSSGNDYSDDLKVMALDIVEECGRLPVGIVAVAKMLKSWPLKDWQAALMILKNSEPLKHDIDDENMTKVYNSLRLSYDYLKNKKSQDLFLLCSLFPEDYEIPIELLSRIAIGLGLYGEFDKYCTARSQVIKNKNILIGSSLLLKVENEFVKMHDLIREVALWIANNKIQMILDSKTSTKENLLYASWNIDDFPNYFDGSKLEVLLVWINASSSVKDPVAIFERMVSLRVLILINCVYMHPISTPSLLQSIQSLTNIRTLSISSWKL